MHTISHTIVKKTGLCLTNRCVKLSGFIFAALLSIGIGGCRKEGFTRLMDVEMKIKVVPDAERIRVGDTVKIIAWLPYKQYDRATNSTADIRNMEVQSWGAINFRGVDSLLNSIVIKNGSHKYEDFFSVTHSYGSFRDYPTNHRIGNMHKNDTAFYFELRLIAREPWVFMIRPTAGRGFMNNGKFRIDIATRIVNPVYHQHLLQKYMSGVTPYDIDYFFEVY